jgi:hypothetical protein
MRMICLPAKTAKNHMYSMEHQAHVWQIVKMGARPVASDKEQKSAQSVIQLMDMSSMLKLELAPSTTAMKTIT